MSNTISGPLENKLRMCIMSIPSLTKAKQSKTKQNVKKEKTLKTINKVREMKSQKCTNDGFIIIIIIFNSISMAYYFIFYADKYHSQNSKK